MIADGPLVIYVTICYYTMFKATKVLHLKSWCCRLLETKILTPPFHLFALLTRINFQQIRLFADLFSNNRELTNHYVCIPEHPWIDGHRTNAVKLSSIKAINRSADRGDLWVECPVKRKDRQLTVWRSDAFCLTILSYQRKCCKDSLSRCTKSWTFTVTGLLFWINKTAPGEYYSTVGRFSAYWRAIPGTGPASPRPAHRSVGNSNAIAGSSDYSFNAIHWLTPYFF